MTKMYVVYYGKIDKRGNHRRYKRQVTTSDLEKICREKLGLFLGEYSGYLRVKDACEGIFMYAVEIDYSNEDGALYEHLPEMEVLRWENGKFVAATTFNKMCYDEKLNEFLRV